MYTLTYAELVALNPCDLNKAVKHFGGSEAWGDRRIGVKEARKAGVPLSDMIWVASQLAQTDVEAQRRIRQWMCDAAEHVLHFFEDEHPNDSRPRETIKVARLYAEGKATAEELRVARVGARKAADAAFEAARFARAAQAAARATQPAAWNFWSAAKWNERAAARAAHKAQEQYQYDRLVYWFTEAEPQPALMEVTHV